MNPSALLWHYRARLLRVHDGDTAFFVLDAGFGWTYTPRHGIRLLGVDAPELHDPNPTIRQKAQEATTFATAWLAEHASHLAGDVTMEWPFVLTTQWSDSFDRPLTRLACGLGHDLSQALLDSGNAIVFHG